MKKVFEIAYKQYFHEQSYEYAEYLKLKRKKKLLQLFAAEHEIKVTDFATYGNWRWDDNH